VVEGVVAALEERLVVRKVVLAMCGQRKDVKDCYSRELDASLSDEEY
jgi:hypothetical protein